MTTNHRPAPPVQLLLDDRRIRGSHSDSPSLDDFGFLRLPVPLVGADVSPIHRMQRLVQTDSTNEAWRARLRSHFPSAWAADGFEDDQVWPVH